MPDGVEDPAEIVAAGGGKRVDGVAAGAKQVISVHAMIELGVTDDGLQAVAALLLAAHGRRQAAFLAGDDVDFLSQICLGSQVTVVAAAPPSVDAPKGANPELVAD